MRFSPSFTTRPVGCMIAAVAATAALSACGSPNTINPPGSGEPPPPYVVSGQVQGWTYSPSTIRALVAERLELQGEIAADGTFQLALPSGSDMGPYLATLPSELCDEGSGSVQVSPVGLQLAGSVYLIVYPAGESSPAGLLFQGFVSATGSEVEANAVDWLYAHSDGGIEGSCSFTSPDGVTLTIGFDLDLEAGWNTVVIEVPPTPTTSTNLRVNLHSGAVPTTATWQFFAFPETSSATLPTSLGRAPFGRSRPNSIGR